MLDVKPGRVHSKAHFYDLYHAGAFGNMPVSWPSLEAVSRDGYRGPLGMRYSGDAGGAKWVSYDIPQDAVPQEIERWRSEGADPTRIRFSMPVPDHATLIQGEVRRSPRWYWYWSTYPAPMRPALAAQGRHSYGLAARLMLEHYLFPSSLADLDALFDLYPESVVELTVFSIPYGTVPGRNAIIWEVRNY